MPVQARLALDPLPQSVGVARRFVREQLAAWGLGALEHVVSLVTSELVTNAVLHARGGLDVVLLRDGGNLRIEVADGSTVSPRRRRYSHESATGRGLTLVEQLGHAWGVRPGTDAVGKVVWVEVRLATAADEEPDGAALAQFGDDWLAQAEQ